MIFQKEEDVIRILTICLFAVVLTGCAGIRYNARWWEPRKDWNSPPETHEEFLFILERAENPDLIYSPSPGWKREVTGDGAQFHNENMKRDLNWAIEFRNRIPGEYSDIRVRAQDLVRNLARGYLSGLWASAERAETGSLEDVATAAEIIDGIAIMADNHILPSDVGTTPRRMRELFLSTAHRDLNGMRQRLNAEFERFPGCGPSVQRSAYPTMEIVSHWIVGYNMTATQLGITEEQHQNIRKMRTAGCISFVK